MRAEHLGVERGRHLVVLFVGRLGLDRDGAAVALGEPALQALGALFGVGGVFVAQPLAQQAADAASHQPVGQQAAFEPAIDPAAHRVAPSRRGHHGKNAFVSAW